VRWEDRDGRELNRAGYQYNELGEMELVTNFV
jgi:hypothetical protein